MKQIYLLRIFIIVYFLIHCAYGSPVNHRADSLQKLLRTTHHDSTKIRLHFLLLETLCPDSIPPLQWLRSEAKRHGVLSYEIKALNKIAGIYTSRGDLNTAGTYYRESVLAAEAAKDTNEMIRQMCNIHGFYFGVSDKTQTLYYAIKGLKIAEAANDKKAIADFYSLLALSYMTAGDLHKALKMQLQNLKRCRELHYDLGIAGALLDIGTTYIALNQREKTIRYYKETIHYVNAVAGTLHAVEIYIGVADAYREQRQFDSAQYYALKAYDTALKLGSKKAMAATLVVMGWIAIEWSHISNAETYALQALKLVNEIHYTAQLPSLYLLLKSIYARQGNYQKSLENYENYIVIRDSLSNEETRKQAAEKEFEYAIEKKEKANELLARQNEIQLLELRQNKYMATGAAVVVVIIMVIIYLAARQNRFRNDHLRVGLEQKLLRAQMNPHFVFNSLNSIQQFIMQGKNGPAEQYLFKFSSLMRDLLESNIKDTITITQEITMLKTYLEMESLRFSSRFTYEISVAETINQHSTSIPHLMIQPFVENAIWHGLLPKKGDRWLKLNIEYHTAETIRCIVDDNGIGREASARQEHTFRKKSLALSFVTQRIELIRKTYGIEGSTTIIDKKDEHDNSAGTTVCLVLPILNSEPYDESNYY